MLTQVFGHTTYAVATVLSAFMAGLALGGYLFGSVADRSENDLRLYAILEGGVGLYGLFVPWLFKLGEKGYLRFFGLNELYPIVFNLLLFSLCFFLVALPALLMGATLPVLSRFFVSNLGQLGRQVGELYALNTLGAVVGTGLAGYYMVPSFGMQFTVYAAAGINLAISVLILFVDQVGRKHWQHSPNTSPADTGTRVDTVSWQRRVLLLSFGLSGFSALVYENSWSRALTLVIGTSVYSFTTMLMTFLVGLSLGGFLYARLLGGRLVKLSLFAFFQLAIGLSALATIPLFERLPVVFLRLVAMFGDIFSLLLFSQLLLSAAVMLPTTLLLGATFPLVVRLVTQDLYRVGRGVGKSYAANTAGAIAGAFAGGFVLIPLLGIQETILLAAMINLLAGALLLFLDVGLRRCWRYALAGAVTAILVLVPVNMPRWDMHVMTSGVAIYNGVYRQFPTDSLRLELMRRDDVLFYREGLTATISVHQSPPASRAQIAMGLPEQARILRTNGKVDGSHNDALTQLLIGYIPALLHADVRTAAVIGLGTGMTAKAVAAFPLHRLDILELEPAMVEAASFFNDVNGNVLDDPRVRLVLTDARNYLLATQNHYDLIASEPSNPWVAGVGSLYTREFYKGVATKLNKDGIFAQWFHDYSMSPNDLRMVLRTFATVFPHVSVWELHRQDFLLVGSYENQVFDHAALKKIHAKNATLRKDLQDLELAHPYSLLGFYRMGREEARAFSAGATLNTDDGAQLEYSAPKNLLWDSSELNHRLMEPFLAESPWARNANMEIPESCRHYYLAQGLRASGQYRNALERVARAIALDPSNPGFYVLKAKILLSLDRGALALEAALQGLDRSLKVLPEVLKLSEAFDRPEARAALYQKAAELRAPGIVPYVGMAMIALLLGAVDEAEAWLEDAKQRHPEHPGVLETAGLLMLRKGALERARSLLEQAEAAGRDTVLLHAALGEVYLRLNLWHDAVRSYRRALRHDMTNTDWRRSLGIAFARSGRRQEAENTFREVLSLRTDDPKAWTELQRLSTRQ